MRTVIFWGAPGCGKTAAVRAFAARQGRHLEIVVPGIREPSDVLGLPDLREVAGRRATDAAMPAWAARLWAAHDAGRPGVLFVDELSTASPAMQAALLGILLEGGTDAWSLPPDCWRLAAANPADCSAGGWELSPPAANRLVHRQWTTPAADAWAAALLSGWSRPPETLLDDPAVPGILGVVSDPAALGRARALVAGFVRTRPTLLHALPREESARGGAWPSPRSWDAAADCVAAVLSAGGDVAAAGEWVAGCVGEPAALEWSAWARAADLPDPESILRAGGEWTPPARGDVQWATAAALAAAVEARPDSGRVEAALAALDRLPVDVAAVHAGVIARAGLANGWSPRGRAAALMGRYAPLVTGGVK